MILKIIDRISGMNYTGLWLVMGLILVLNFVVIAGAMVVLGR